MKLLRLKTPPQDPSGTFANSTVEEVASWLDDLPRGNADAFGDALREALQRLNRSKLARANRIEVMERIRPVVNDACAMLVAHYKSSPLPLAEDDQADCDLVRQLYAELAAGFKIGVNEQADIWERGARHAPVLPLQLSIQRAILCLGRTLVESYRVYAPEPPLLWSDLHTLYRNAELARLLALPLEGSRDADETALSIKQAYLRVAVLAMANPYHLMQGEAEELYRRIGRWLNFVQIKLPNGDDDLGGCFAVDLASDFPARFLPRGAKLPPLREPRILELDKLTGTVDAQIAHSNEVLAGTGAANSLSGRMQRDMYQRFRAALGGRNERSSERRSVVSRLILVEGLSACHFYLNGRRPFAPEQAEAQWSEKIAAVSKGDGLRLMDESDRGRPLGPARGRNSQFQGYDREADDIWRKANLVAPAEQEKAQRKTRHRAAIWHRKNESDGGLALFCPQDCPMQVRVGEVVVYADEDSVNPAQWRIGAIRWLRTRANGGLELGIKHLAANGYALGTRAVTGAGSGSEYLRAILAPRVNPLLQPATLITPAGVYDVGTVLQLNMTDLVLYAELTALIETSRLFAHFRFKIVEAPSPKPAGAPKGTRPRG